MKIITGCLVGLPVLLVAMAFLLLICVPLVLWLFLSKRDWPDHPDAPFIERDDPQIHHFMFDERKQLDKTTIEFFIK